MSNNPLIDQIMGQGRSIREDVPVPCAVMPRRSYRDRLERQRQRRDPEGLEQREDESLDNVRSVIGEADDGSIIPDKADDLDDVSRNTVTTRLNPIKDVVQEPSHPSGEKEKYLTPYAALTAPDATPDALSPIDPSRVPGTATQKKFTWGELEQGAPVPPPEPEQVPTGGGDVAVNAMDVLLGRDRSARPAKNTQEFDQAGQIATEEQAMAAMGIENPAIVEAAQAKAAAAMVANPDPSGSSLMPEHKHADVKKVCEVARRWI